MTLENWIFHENDSEELLPLCHTTKWKYFEKIISNRKLLTSFSRFPDPNPTSTQEENLVYLFYGLPFYIYETGNGNDINSEVTEDLPIGLIFKQNFISNTDRFYPFDTGALFSNKYRNILDIDIDNDLLVYEVKITDGIEIKKLIKRYYKTNENYCYGNLNKSREATHPKEENLLRLFLDERKSELDFRNRAIEVHSLKDIDIENNLLAIVLPRLRTSKYAYLEQNIKSLSNNIDIIYYNDLRRYNSESIRYALIDATLNFYNEKYPNSFSYDRVGKV